MTSAFTSALNRARDTFDRNLVKRGQSRDSSHSIETSDSPFASSLVTPVDADNHAYLLPSDVPDFSGAARLFGSTNRDGLKGSSSASLMDYFGFKNYNLQSGGLPVLLSRSRTFQSSQASASASPLEEAQTQYSTSRSMSSVFDVRPSPSYSSPGSVEEESLAHKSIYNFPNKPIVIKAKRSLVQGTTSSRVEERDNDINRSTSPISEIGNYSLPRLSSRCEGGGGCSPTLDSDLGDMENPDPLWFLRSAVWSPMTFAVLFFRAILFVPWCISVGGSILLLPDKLEPIAFQTGYVDSIRGIRRFSHWAEVGVQLVMIFLAFVLCILWFLPMSVRMLLVFALGARFVLVWKGVQVDYSIPLGEDDKQSFYLLAILGERGLMEGTRTVTKTETGFFVVPA